ncbi:hypothetical protein [Embleya sp. NPDC020886]|uniref:hypothetical protein n=1 Tax=Embleya sp. NPDC020886 TaxID=3363980 RepID=UPI0037A1195C
MIITPTEVYAEVRATGDAVRELTTKLDNIPNELLDHEARIRVLERGRWPLPSLAAVTGVAALAVAAWQASGH